MLEIVEEILEDSEGISEIVDDSFRIVEDSFNGIDGYYVSIPLKIMEFPYI